MLFSTDVLVVNISLTGIGIYSKSLGLVGQLDLTEKQLNFMEIQDTPAFTGVFSKFLESHNVKNYKKAVVCIDPELVFSNSISTLGVDDEKKYVEEYLETIPLDKQNISHKTITTHDAIKIYAVNAVLYRVVVAVLKDLGCTTTAVIPLDEALSEVSEFLADKKVLRERNLMEMSHENPVNNKRLTTVTIITIVGVGVIVASLVLLNQFGNSQKLKVVHNVQESTESSASQTNTLTNETPIVEEQPSYKSKEELTISVLNGSRKPGEATKVKNLLTEAGFANIETGNSEEVNTGTTKILYNASISAEDVENIKLELSKAFTTVEESSSSESSETANTDITIITGK